jgi:GNAT superfamily N-acetyltransferase
MLNNDTRAVVKLQLDVQRFDVQLWHHYVRDNEQAGIRFSSLAERGDTEANRRRVYELNKTCSADIPGRDPFYSYAQYRDVRFQTEVYTAAGVLLAVAGPAWVGLSAASYHKAQGFMFNEMTGVVREYRHRGIATALKVLAIGFAQSLGVPVMYTVHADANHAAIAMNRRLGYTDCR